MTFLVQYRRVKSDPEKGKQIGDSSICALDQQIVLS
ncbi:Uncharacterised protein [Mycobacteroides abscessus]|nr:Uncharacterised protein [Mycobacteroides abscessus]SHV34951.1 Uncharacterised protein [Mycobacteroides abscessus subsp. abscessus]SIM14935.1 Uncharacterised protein [Mycobacteroides abscessus subsp. abscessus]